MDFGNLCILGTCFGDAQIPTSRKTTRSLNMTSDSNYLSEANHINQNLRSQINSFVNWEQSLRCDCHNNTISLTSSIETYPKTNKPPGNKSISHQTGKIGNSSSQIPFKDGNHVIVPRVPVNPQKTTIPSLPFFVFHPCTLIRSIVRATGPTVMMSHKYPGALSKVQCGDTPSDWGKETTPQVQHTPPQEIAGVPY